MGLGEGSSYHGAVWTVGRVQIQLSVGPCHPDFPVVPEPFATFSSFLVLPSGQCGRSAPDSLSSSALYSFSKLFDVHASAPWTLPFGSHSGSELPVLCLGLIPPRGKSNAGTSCHLLAAGEAYVVYFQDFRQKKSR